MLPSQLPQSAAHEVAWQLPLTQATPVAPVTAYLQSKPQAPQFAESAKVFTQTGPLVVLQGI
jgi:hypothetical protein